MGYASLNTQRTRVAQDVCYERPTSTADPGHHGTLTSEPPHPSFTTDFPWYHASNVAHPSVVPGEAPLAPLTPIVHASKGPSAPIGTFDAGQAQSSYASSQSNNIMYDDYMDYSAATDMAGYHGIPFSAQGYTGSIFAYEPYEHYHNSSANVAAETVQQAAHPTYQSTDVQQSLTLDGMASQADMVIQAFASARQITPVPAQSTGPSTLIYTGIKETLAPSGFPHTNGFISANNAVHHQNISDMTYPLADDANPLSHTFAMGSLAGAARTRYMGQAFRTHKHYTGWDARQ